MTMARLQAFYTVAELAKLSGLSRYKVAKALESVGVEIGRTGNRRFVYLPQLQRAMPQLWAALSEGAQRSSR